MIEQQKITQTEGIRYLEESLIKAGKFESWTIYYKGICSYVENGFGLSEEDAQTFVSPYKFALAHSYHSREVINAHIEGVERSNQPPE